MAAFEGDGFEVATMPDITLADRVRNHLQPKPIYVKRGHRAPNLTCIGIGSNCYREPGYGLELCFRGYQP